jgi:hypothetical protein
MRRGAGKAPWRPIAATLVMAVTLLAGGCRENEQNRPLTFSPHVYQGNKTAPLTGQQTRELQERGNLQR